MAEPSLTSVSATGRPVAPGGWRRGVIGGLVGLVVGFVAVALGQRPSD